MSWLLFSYLISLGLKKVKQTSVATNTLRINLYIGIDALLSSSVTDLCGKLQAGIHFSRGKKEKVFPHPLYRERFHLFGFTTLLTNFHSVVKKEKKKIFQSVDIISRQPCQHHNLQEIVDVLKQTLYLLIDPEYLKKKKNPHSFGGLFLNVTLMEYLRELSNLTHILWTWGKHKLQLRRLL